MDDYMTIGKAARLINVNPRTLRFYEQIGLVYPSNHSEGGYRLYSLQDIEKLKFIIRAKKIGLTLDEIKSILSLTKEGLCLSVKQRVGEMLALKICDIDNQIDELLELKKEFTNFKEYLDKKKLLGKNSSTCSCLE